MPRTDDDNDCACEKCRPPKKECYRRCECRNRRNCNCKPRERERDKCKEEDCNEEKDRCKEKEKPKEDKCIKNENLTYNETTLFVSNYFSKPDCNKCSCKCCIENPRIVFVALHPCGRARELCLEQK